MSIHLIGDNLIQEAVSVIRTSFQTVADEFNLTPDNCPGHPAFISADELRSRLQMGAVFYGYFDDDQLIGVIGILKVYNDEHCIEKLAVLPNYRHAGIGHRLMSFAMEQIHSDGGHKITLGIINENAVLKHWYESQGFHTVEIKNFPHLPFAVCIMCNSLP